MKKKISLSVICGFLFLLLIFALKCINVEAIGDENKKIGLAYINDAIHNFTGVNLTWYKITNVLGYLAIVIALLVLLLSFIQFIKRKSILKMDKELIAVDILYVILGAIYVFFEKVIINYRPIIMKGDKHVEASFPSSHTMLACVIMGSVFILIGRYLINRKLKVVLQIAITLYILIVVCGRLISGVHWLTDIIGGVLISVALISAYSAVIGNKSEDEEVVEASSK